MILCAAIKLYNNKETIIVPNIRHSLCYSLLNQLIVDYHQYDIEEGFISTKNKFFNRKEAYQYAIECGQLPLQLRIDKEKKEDLELYSEDLY